MSKNSLSNVECWSVVSEGYEQTTMNFLSQYSESAITLSTEKTNANVLDLACGPGTLARLLYKRVGSITAVDFSENMIHLLNHFIQNKKINNITTLVGDGQALNLSSSQFSHVFSMFGLMFFPDRRKGFSESYRLLRPDGELIVSSWAPIKQSPAMELMFGLISAISPNATESKSSVTNLEDPINFKKEFEDAGFSNIIIQPVTHELEISSIDEFWVDMVKGSAPIAFLKKSTTIQEWKVIEQKGLAYLKTVLSHLPNRLSADAWIGKGEKLS